MTQRQIEFERLHNFRDLGGYRSVDGRTIRWGLLYRADSLGKLAGEDWRRFLDLGIRTVVDLRYPWEIEAKGRVPEAHRFNYVNCSIEHRPYDQAEIDPDVDPWRFLADRFAEVAADGVKEIRQAIKVIAHEDGPTVVHCTSGKDRTGLLVALVLSLLGVPREQILADFALTERATERLIVDWKAANPNRKLKWPSYGRAPAEIMWLVFADIAANYRSVDDYLTHHVGIDSVTTESLGARLLDRRPARAS